MQDAISIIKDEHISISSVLKGLVTHVEEAESGTREVDPHLISAMLDYVEAYPERLHHPKEDQYLFRLLRKRTHELDDILDELENEHAQSRSLIVSMRAALKELKDTGNLKAFSDVLSQYAKFHFAHMRKEEKDIIPVAIKCLTDEDWKEINDAFSLNANGWS